MSRLDMLLAAIASVVVPVVPSALGLDVTMVVFNVPLQVIGACAAGSLASFAYGEPEASRKRMYVLSFVNMLIGAFAVGIIPAAFSLEWIEGGVQAGCGFFISMLCRFVIPQLLKAVPMIVGEAIKRLITLIPVRKA